MSLEEVVEDIIIDILETSRHPAVQCSYEELGRDKYTNKDFDTIFDEVLGIVEDARIDERTERGEKKIETVALLVIAKWAEDEKFTDELDDREYRKVEMALEDYAGLIDRLDGRSRDRGRGRGRDRDDRSGRRRRRSSRRGDDYSASDRDSRSGRRSDRGRNEGRRRSSRGDEFRSGRRRDNDPNEPKTLTQRRAEQMREAEAQEVALPQTPNEIRRNKERVSDRDTRRNEAITTPSGRREAAQNERSYDFVGEAEVTVDPDISKAEAELGFTYAEVPVGTIEDYLELEIDIKDPKFIMTRPIDKTDTHREIIYDPFVVQPVWELSENGYRVLRFRDFNMNIDNHVIPDFKRTSSVPSRAVNHAVLPSLAQPSRRSILDVAKKQDEEERRYEERLAEWETHNNDLPDEDKDKKPEEPGFQKLGSHTLRVDEPIDSSSLGDMMKETMSHFGQLRGFSEGHPPVESYGTLRQFAWCCASVEERDEIMNQVEMFSTAHSHRSEDGKNVVPIHKYHEALMAVVDTIPFGLWKRINRLMTEYCNEVMTINLGLHVTIDDFAADGDKILQYLYDNYGEAVMNCFVIGHAQAGGRISMLEAGKGDTDLLIYEVKGTQVTILPVSPEELAISSVKIDETLGYSAPALVTGESNLRLFNALRTVVTQNTPVMGKQTPYKYLAFSDGTVYRIDRNALGLSGENKRGTVEFLLTQIKYC